MSRLSYNWKRFWSAPGASVNLNDNGFLVDPDGEYGAALNPHVVPWGSICDVPCLILLGEPGIGKSEAMKAEAERMTRLCEGTLDRVLMVDLRAFQTDQRLHQRVFESFAIKSWKNNGESLLHLFLDSMDEGLIRFDNLGLALLDEFRDLPVDRLRLRIASRTADWPRGLQADFEQVWRAGNVQLYELAPLRRADVLEAARVNGIDPPTLLIDDIFRQDIVPLAIKPVTLQFLLNIRRRQAGMPSTQGELYAKGCRLLCEEARPGQRPAGGNPGERTADQRLAIAARIAAITMFCGRDAFWTDIDCGEVPIEDLRVGDLVAQEVGQGPCRTAMDRDGIWQALNTGLFSSRGLPRIGWAHQTYAEFLAAKFLLESGTSVEQIMSLILASDGKVVPQLRECAAWLASMVPAVFQELVAIDPMVLLESYAGSSDLNERRALTASLLLLFEKGSLLDLGWGLWQRYPKLTHPQLDAQLRPYIRGKDKGLVVRRVAMMIAQTCEIASLEPDLVAASLDSSEEHELRVAAGFAISRFGSVESKQALRPLVIDANLNDPDDDLKGCGLLSAWPGSISTNELFEALTARKEPNRIGLYMTFLRKNIVDAIAPDDLPVALAWTGRESECRDSISPFARLADEIRTRALGFLDLPLVASALAGSTWRWLTSNGIYPSRNDKFKARLAAESDRRRELVLLLAAIARTEENSTFYLCHGQLISIDDFSWLLERHRSADHPGLTPVWIDLIRRTFDPRDPRRTELLVEASKTDLALAAEFRWLLDPDSPEARSVRERQAEWERSIPARPTPPPVLDPPPAQRVLSVLERIETGEIESFVRLSRDLTLRPESTRYREEDEFEMSWPKLAGWNDADCDIKKRIINAANRYLTEYSPTDPIVWVATSTFPWDMLAGYRALFLMLSEDRVFLDGLSSDAWAKWASITLAYPIADEPDGGARLDLLTQSYKAVPDVILETLGRLIERENEALGNLYVLQRVEPIWDSTISTYLANKLTTNLKLASFGQLLGDLLRHKAPAAKEFAENLLEKIPVEGVGRDRAVVAARALLREIPEAAWPLLWPMIQRDVAFGLTAFEGVWGIWEKSPPSFAKQLSDDQLSDLYIWLETNVPRIDGEPQTGFGVIGAAQTLRWLRDILLTELKGRGTPTACDGLRRAVRELPQCPRLPWHLEEAERFARSVAWRPLESAQLNALIASLESRLVQNTGQLLQILIRSLTRLEQEMQGETPAGFTLWDEHAGRPKSEVRISDCIKLHFQRDIALRGIVVNREVEIRKGTGGAPGEETDIHVDAIIKGPGDTYDRISVIIEVKGCWNRDVLSAMETQLADRYLKENACPYGLYVVGWFVCDQWKEDPRKSMTPDITLAEARDYFNKQAISLSNDTRQLASFVLNLALR